MIFVIVPVVSARMTQSSDLATCTAAAREE